MRAKARVKPKPKAAAEPLQLREGADVILRFEDVLRAVALSRSTVLAMIRDGAFPRPVKIYGRTSRWHGSAVYAWMQKQKGD